MTEYYMPDIPRLYTVFAEWMACMEYSGSDPMKYGDGYVRGEKSNMKNTRLLIMAAGIGSRFGTGIKQLEPVDDANHIIMDYSIHDAIETGFNHVVFII